MSFNPGEKRKGGAAGRGWDQGPGPAEVSHEPCCRLHSCLTGPSEAFTHCPSEDCGQISAVLKGPYFNSCSVQEILHVSSSFSRHEAQAVELNQQLINWNIVVFNETFILIHTTPPPPPLLFVLLSETTFALRLLSSSRASPVMLAVLSGGT